MIRIVAILLAALLMVGDALAIKPAVSILSPEMGKTWAYGGVKKRKLYWNKKEKRLEAWVTFSNERYADYGDTKSEDLVTFPLPGVEFDEHNGVFFVRDDRGNVLPVAIRKKEFIGTSIEPTPNSNVRIITYSGVAEVTLDVYHPEEAVILKEQIDKEDAAARKKEEDGKPARSPGFND